VGEPNTVEHRSGVFAATRRLTELPLLPVVVVELLRLDARSDELFEHVVALVQRDPGFAARVVGSANAAVHAARTPLRHTRDAVARLGARPTVNLVITSAMTTIFLPRAGALWCHALQVAELARALAAQARGDGEEAYLAGLLHDLGRFILYLDDPSAADIHATRLTSEELARIERTRYGITHTELGHEAAARWRLPDAIDEAIREHHASSAPILSTARTLDAVRAADAASRAVGVEDAWLDMPDDALRDCLRGQRALERLWTDRSLQLLRAAFAQARVAAIDLGIAGR